MIEAPCPQCGQLAAGLKGQGFTQCFVCGSQRARGGGNGASVQVRGRPADGDSNTARSTAMSSRKSTVSST